MAGTRAYCRLKCLVYQLHNGFRHRPLHPWSDVRCLGISRTLHQSCALLTSNTNRPKYHPETEAFIKFTEEQSPKDGKEESSVGLIRKRLYDQLVISSGEVEFNGTITDIILSGPNGSNLLGMSTALYHPETVAYLKLVKEHSLRSDVREYTPELARRERNDVIRHISEDAAFDGRISDVSINSSHSAEKNTLDLTVHADVERSLLHLSNFSFSFADGIPATVYVPARIPEDAAILVYFHGGGMVIGSRASVDTTCRRLAMETPCIIVNVEYRLAPEYKFPASSEDALDAVNWVVKNKVTIDGTEKSPVGVGGDSCGGTLAATVAHQVPGLAFQVLVYPRVNYKSGPARRSAKDYEDGPILSKDVVAWYRGHFLRGDADQEDPLLNPYSREGFAKLPPALLVVAECDPLRDDSYDYQAKMAEAGVKAEVLQIDGACHSFFTKPGIFVKCCAVAYKRVTEFIREVAYTQ